MSALDVDDWQKREIEIGRTDCENGRTVEHEKVRDWLKSWGSPEEASKRSAIEDA